MKYDQPTIRASWPQAVDIISIMEMEPWDEVKEIAHTIIDNGGEDLDEFLSDIILQTKKTMPHLAAQIDTRDFRHYVVCKLELFPESKECTPGTPTT